MNIIVTATGPTIDDKLEPRFGRTPYLLCIDTDTGEVRAIDNASNAQAAQGAGIQTASRAAELGAQAIITGDVGPKAFQVLGAAGLTVHLADGQVSVAEALEQWKAGELRHVDQPSVGAHRGGR